MKKNKEKWLKINRDSFTRTLKGFERPDYTLDINGLPRNSIPQVIEYLAYVLKSQNLKYNYPKAKQSALPTTRVTTR